MNKVFDKSQKSARVGTTTYSPGVKMPEGQKDYESDYNPSADPEARASFDSIRNEEELMSWLRKYDRDEYEQLKTMKPEDHILEARVAEFINAFNSEDYYRFITGEGRSKEDDEMIILLSKQSSDFGGVIKMYQREYKEMGFDNEKFRQRLIRKDTFIQEMREKLINSQNNLDS